MCTRDCSPCKKDLCTDYYAIPEQVLEPDDEPVDLRVLRVVDGLGYVVDEEVVDVVVPVQDLKYRLVSLPNLTGNHQKLIKNTIFNSIPHGLTPLKST